MHSCIGRTLAAGMPIPGPPFHESNDHLYGLVTLMVEAAIQRGVAPDPELEPVPDRRTRRWTRWREYPVTFSKESAAVAGASA